MWKKVVVLQCTSLHLPAAQRKPGHAAQRVLQPSVPAALAQNQLPIAPAPSCDGSKETAKVI